MKNRNQGTGIGKDIMVEAENCLRAVGCPKINLQLRSTNTTATEFYKKIGFKVDDVVSLAKNVRRNCRQ